MPANAEYSLPENSNDVAPVTPEVAPREPANREVVFPRLHDETFSKLKAIMGGATAGRETRGQRPDINKNLVDNLRQNEGNLFSSEQKMNPTTGETISGLKEVMTGVTEPAVSAPEMPVNQFATDAPADGAFELPPDYQASVAAESVTTPENVVATMPETANTIEAVESVKPVVGDAPIESSAPEVVTGSQLETGLPENVITVPEPEAVEEVNADAQPEIVASPESVELEQVDSSASLEAVNQTEAENASIEIGEIAASKPESDDRGSAVLEAASEVEAVGPAIPVPDQEAFPTSGVSEASLPETSPKQALVDAKPLTMQEAEGMPREEVEARLSQMTSEERMAFFQELDTEDRVNETIGAMQKFSQDEREREGIAPQNIEVVEVDDRGRVVNVEIKPTSETPAAQERESGENEAAGEHLPEPALPVFEETNSYQITENGPEEARGPEIYDGESFGENEAKDAENNFEQNDEILSKIQENIDGSIEEEPAETTPESMDGVSPETETETLPEYLVDGGFLESERENAESELPAPEQAGELETEIAGFAAQLERVTSRELAEHDRRIDLLERKQERARRMNAQLDTYARYTRMYEELRRTQLRLVAMEAELEKAA